MNAGKLNVLTDCVALDNAVLGHSINLNLLGALQELSHYNRVLLTYYSSVVERSLKFSTVTYHTHGCT